MKTIGLIGGMSWESTLSYYKIINEVVKQKLGGYHSAKCILYSVDFHEIEECQSRGDWEKSGEILAAAAQTLQTAGANYIVICTNTMHKVVDRIQQKITIPLLHIAEATAAELQKQEITKVALLGTKYTMQQDFYKSKLIDAGLEVLIPEPEDMELINKTIYQELCLGNVSHPSKLEFLRIIASMTDAGAEGIILGCTEIGLLVKQSDTFVPLFDTTLIHATQAALYSLED